MESPPWKMQEMIFSSPYFVNFKLPWGSMPPDLPTTVCEYAMFSGVFEDSVKSNKSVTRLMGGWGGKGEINQPSQHFCLGCRYVF